MGNVFPIPLRGQIERFKVTTMDNEYKDKAIELERFTNLLANLLAKYANEVDIASLPDKETPEPTTE